MSDKTAAVLRRVASILLSIAALLCAIALAAACVSIYRSGNRPFTPESISAAWRRVAIFVWSFLFCAVGTGVLHLLFPAPARKAKATVFPEIRLAKIKARLARKQYSQDLLRPLVKQERFVLILRVSVLPVCLLCAAYPLLYLNNLDNFTSIDAQLNAQVLDAVIPSLCFALVALGYCWAVRLLCSFCCEGAIRYAKAIMLLPAPAAEKKPSGKQTPTLSKNTIFVLRVVLLAAALAMIALGIFNGGVQDVLQKAIKICTECIGLG